MLRVGIILILSVYSLAGYGQVNTFNPKNTFALKQINENYSQNIFWDSSKYCIEEDNSLNVFGRIHKIFELAPISEKATSNFFCTHSITFVQKLLLLHRIDLPPPRS